MAHNSAYYQQPQQAMYQSPAQPPPPPQLSQYQQSLSQQLPPSIIYQPTELQQPQLGRAPPGQYQGPQYQIHHQTPTQDYRQQLQQQPAHQYVQQPQRYQPPPLAQGASIAQHIPLSQSLPAATMQYQSTQPSYPVNYGPHILQQFQPDSQPQPSVLHSHSQSLPPMHTGPNPNPLVPQPSRTPQPQFHPPPPPATQFIPTAQSAPIHPQVTSGHVIQPPISSVPSAPVRRPLPEVAQRTASLPPAPVTSAPPLTPTNSYHDQAQPITRGPQPSFTPPQNPHPMWDARGPQSTHAVAAPPVHSVTPLSTQEMPKPPPSSRITSSFAAGATVTPAQVPPTIGVAPIQPSASDPSGSASKRRPLPSPATKQQSLDMGRFNSPPSLPKIDENPVPPSTRSESPTKTTHNGPSNLPGPLSRDENVVPTTMNSKVTLVKRRASPPRWTENPGGESGRSRSVSPTKNSAPGEIQQSHSNSRHSQVASSSFAAARSIFSGAAPNQNKPLPPPAAQIVRIGSNKPVPPPRSGPPPSQSAPPQFFPPKKPMWRRTVPDPGDGKDIDFIGKSSFDPAMQDPNFKAHTKAFSLEKARASTFKPPGGRPPTAPAPVAVRSSVYAGIGPPLPPAHTYAPQRYGNKEPSGQKLNKGHHIRQASSYEDIDEDEDEGTQESDSDDGTRARKAKYKDEKESRKKKSKEKLIKPVKDSKGKEERVRNKNSKAKFRSRGDTGSKGKPRHTRELASDDSSLRTTSGSESATTSDTESLEARHEQKSSHSKHGNNEHRYRTHEREQEREWGPDRERQRERDWDRDREGEREYDFGHGPDGPHTHSRFRGQDSNHRRGPSEANARGHARDAPPRPHGTSSSSARSNDGTHPPMAHEVSYRDDTQNYDHAGRDRGGYADRDRDRDRSAYEPRHERSLSDQLPSTSGRRVADSPVANRHSASAFTPRSNAIQMARKMRDIDLNLDDAPPVSLRRSPSPGATGHGQQGRREMDMYVQQSQTIPTRSQPQPRSFGQQDSQPRYRQDSPQQAPAHRPSRQPPPQQSHYQQHEQQQTPSPPRNTPTLSFSGPDDEPPRNRTRGTGNDHEYGSSQGSNFNQNRYNDNPPPIPVISVQEFDEPPNSYGRSNSGGRGNSGNPPPPKIQVFEVPSINFSGPDEDHYRSRNNAPPPPMINVSGPGDDEPRRGNMRGNGGAPQQQPPQINVPSRAHNYNINHMGGGGTGPGVSVAKSSATIQRRPGLVCAGCDGIIVGRILSAMGLRWHPDCFRCTICRELLEHVSSYESGGLPYCHLDYHENFAPRCYHCKTPIIEERFISLDDTSLGKRNYHEQHFFCAECGDPFLSPASTSAFKGRTGEINVNGDGEFESGDIGFTVYKGYPYCENCHVRLRMPKCKRCQRSIRDGEEAVEALGGKWCWNCFVCTGCQKPFDDPAFFERAGKPFCEPCFSIILRNEL